MSRQECGSELGQSASGANPIPVVAGGAKCRMRGAFRPESRESTRMIEAEAR